MKSIYYLFFLFLSSFCFSQTTNLGIGIPTFNGSNPNLSFEKKTQDIKDKTQLFISKKIGVDFVKNILKPGDSIEFSYEYVIGVNGHPIPNKTKVNTQYEFFNNKIQRIINILPKFQPAVAIRTKEPYPYPVNFNAEFYVNQAYTLVPIYRQKITKGLSINSDDININSLYDAVNKDRIIKTPIKGHAYFSTGNKMEITHIRTVTNYQTTTHLLINSIKSLKLLGPDIFSKLVENKNYLIDINISKPTEEATKFETPDKFAIYEGCEKTSDNDAIKKCTSEKLSKFVNKNFDADLCANLGLWGRQKILVAFIIGIDGKTTGIRARAPHPALQKEAERVIKHLPKFTPAKKDGKPIASPYSLPIIFYIEKENSRPTGRNFPSRKYLYNRTR